jgi:hypothetical protein
MKIRTITLNLNEPSIREQFLEIDKKVSNGELLSIEDLAIFSNISYYDIQNKNDIISMGGVLEQYCNCSRLIAQDIESLKYDKIIFENLDKIKFILNNLKRSIQLKDIKSENECLTPKETCIFYSDNTVFDEIADEMRIMVTILNRYFYFGDSAPIRKIEVQSSVNFEKFNSEIFKDQESYNLFLFLVNEYAVKKSVTQFSQIYHWLVVKDNKIKTNKGVKYRDFVKNHFNLEGVFARISDIIYNEQVTISDISKRLHK